VKMLLHPFEEQFDLELPPVWLTPLQERTLSKDAHHAQV
jgi:hypothetical protein